MDDDYLIPTTYEEWRKRMEKIIKRQQKELVYYINRYLNADINLQGSGDIETLKKNLLSVIKKHYRELIIETLENILENTDLLNTVSMAKDEYVYFLSKDGTPYVKYVGVKVEKLKIGYVI